MNTLATWDDENGNRQIQFSVEYKIESGNVDVQKVTPQKVTFICPETNSCIRSIGVWTEGGRRLLAEKFSNSPAIAQLKAVLASITETTPHLTISNSEFSLNSVN
jgi:hypothetical protein